MEDEFNVLSLAKTSNEVEVKYFWKRFSNRLYKKYLMKQLPILKDKFDYLEESGYNIILPFTEESVEQYELGYIKDFIKKVLDKNDINHIYIPNKLKKYVDIKLSLDYSILKYAVLDQIMKKVLINEKISYKELRLIIIDSEDYKVDYLLELFVRDLNYLTIITNRGEYFNSIKEMIYDSTGLVIDVMNNPIREEIEGNVIIDASTKLNKNYNYFKKNAVVIDLESNKEKLQYLYSRRKDLETIYDVVLSTKGSIVNNEMLDIFLCAKSYIYQNFKRINSRSYGLYELFEVMSHYEIKLKDYKTTRSKF